MHTLRARLAPFSKLAFIAASLALAGVSMSAQAALTSPVTVTLSAPGGVIGDSTPVSVTDIATTASGITAGDGSTIGSGWMEPNEFIHFSDNSILLDIAAGNVNSQGQSVTGYLGSGANHAAYQLSNLAVAGNAITGVSGSFTGLSSPTTFASIVSLTSPSSLTVNLDSLVFTAVAGGQSLGNATVTINLQVSPVPEPASWALLTAGAVGLVGWRRMRKLTA